MARTGDQTKVLVAASDTSGNLAILDSNGNVLTGPIAAGSGTIALVAANPSGTVFAVVLVSNGASQIILLDGGLNQIAAQPSTGTLGLAFSLDGKFLYASSNVAAAPAIQVYSGQTLQLIGQVPDLTLQGIQSEIEAADETQLLFSIANRGVSLIDAAAPAALPSEGAAAGGASVGVNGASFKATAIVTFGSQPATSVTGNSRQSRHRRNHFEWRRNRIRRISISSERAGQCAPGPLYISALRSASPIRLSQLRRGH
jgi:hypothetical protein